MANLQSALPQIGVMTKMMCLDDLMLIKLFFIVFQIFGFIAKTGLQFFPYVSLALKIGQIR